MNTQSAALDYRICLASKWHASLRTMLVNLFAIMHDQQGIQTFGSHRM